MATHPEYTVRSGKASDIPQLAAIERSAGQLFSTVGLQSVAEDDPMPPEVLSSYLEASNLWVAVAHHAGCEEVVAFLAAFPITVTGSKTSGNSRLRPRHQDSEGKHAGGNSREVLMHIAELSVHSDHHRKGLGKRLMQHFEQTVTTRSPDNGSGTVVGLSLTTYRDVPFNGPFYTKLGFEEVQAADIENVVGKRGRELWDEEQQKIASPERRMWGIKWAS